MSEQNIKSTPKEIMICLLLTTFEMLAYLLIPSMHSFIDSVFLLFSGSTAGAITLFSLQLWLAHKLRTYSPKLIEFIKKVFSNRLVLLIGSAVMVFIVAIIVTVCHVRIVDKTIPTINASKPDNRMIASEQNINPLVYRVYVDDETALGKVELHEEDFLISGCTADIFIAKYDKNTFNVIISNLVGTAGKHQVFIKEGAIEDRAGNKSKQVELYSFYLYHAEDEIDQTPPRVAISEITSGKETVSIVMVAEDNTNLSSFGIQSNDIVLFGCKADVSVDNHSGIITITLRNITDCDNGKFNIGIVPGVATDGWGNESEMFVSNEIPFLPK